MKEKLSNVDEFSAQLERDINSKVWIMGEDTFKTCCKIVALGLDFGLVLQWTGFHCKEGQDCSSSDSCVTDTVDF